MAELGDHTQKKKKEKIKPNKVEKKKGAEINEIRKRENNREKPMKPKASS